MTPRGTHAEGPVCGVVEEDVVDVHVAGRGDEQGVRPGHAAIDRDGRLRASAAEH